MRYTEEDILSAVEAGVFTEEAGQAFREYVALRRQTPLADEEQFRLITGFNDIFVVIASALLLVSVGWIGLGAAPWLGPMAVAACAWGLAEFFVRKRRMALPAIVLLLVFVGGCYAFGAEFLERTGYGTFSLIGGSAAALIGAWLHWLRFRVPITVAAGAAAALGLAVTSLLTTVQELVDWLPFILFLCGLIVFALAMWWDASDTARLTRRADVAFWLHLLAAPLLVHPIFFFLGLFKGQTMPWQAFTVVGLYMGIALVSLCIDRRALMVSSLFYVLYAFSTLLKLYGAVDLSFALTALVIGSLLLLLSVFWHSCRAFFLGFVPEAVRKRLAPLHVRQQFNHSLSEGNVSAADRGVAKNRRKDECILK